MPRRFRYLLCLPRGGFNDTLCQLEICARFAHRTRRIAVIDTRLSGLGADVFDYFSLKPTELLRPAAPGEVVLDAGRVFFSVDGTEATFDLPPGDGAVSVKRAEDGPEAVMLHYSAGGGDLGIAFLERLELRPELAGRIAARVAAAGDDYVSVHIRHTDYRTDFAEAFRLIVRRMGRRRLLLCSDSEAPIAHFRETYGNWLDWSTSDSARSTDDSPLHYRGGDETARRNEDMLTDLYLLARGRQLVMVDTQNSKRSGFAVLAAHLRRRLDIGRSGPEALRTRGRFGPWLRDLARGTLFRVWRCRKALDRPGGRLILHPTPE